MFRSRKKLAEQVRLETLSEVGRRLTALAVARFDQHGPYDTRGAALWDAGWYVLEELGDGEFRGQSDDGRNEFVPDWASAR